MKSLDAVEYSKNNVDYREIGSPRDSGAKKRVTEFVEDAGILKYKTSDGEKEVSGGGGIVLDLGSRMTGDRFDLTDEEISILFGYPSPEVKVRIANYDVSIFKYDQEQDGDKAFYTNVLIYSDGKRYHVNMDVDRTLTENQAIIYRTEEPVVTEEMVRNVQKEHIPFNQLISPDDLVTSETSGVGISSLNDGGLNVLGTVNTETNIVITKAIPINSNHKYVMSYATNVRWGFVYANGITELSDTIEKGEIFTGATTFKMAITIKESVGDIPYNYDIYPMLIDLTDIYGVGHEPSNTADLMLMIDFNKFYPYTDKPNRDEVNSLSMCPSDTIDNIDIVSQSTTFNIPSNGYLKVFGRYMTGTGNNNINISLYDSENNVKEDADLSISDTINEQTLIIPISKEIHHITIVPRDFGEINDFTITANFIHAKEI